MVTDDGILDRPNENWLDFVSLLGLFILDFLRIREDFGREEESS